MSAFEVTITPTRLKTKRVMESREPTDVIMAPFSSKAIVQFEDVPVTKTAKRILRVVNPSNNEIKVKVTKSIKPEHNITVSWTEEMVPAQSEIMMEMVWSPLIDLACKETLQLTDNRNFRKDVMVILKSKSLIPPKNMHKFPTISSGTGNGSSTHVKSLRLKSPNNTTKFSNKIVAQQRKRLQQKNDKQKISKEVKPHWNSGIYPPFVGKPLERHQTVQISSHSVPLAEHNNYLSTDVEGVVHTSHMSPVVTREDGDLKENISPLTPGNVINIIDNFEFTPDNQTPLNTCLNSEYLHLWPTPVNSEQTDTNNLRQVRPRRLTTDLIEAEDPIGYTHSITIKVEEEVLNGTKDNIITSGTITNKTFEVKRADFSDISTDNLDASISDVQLSFALTPMNKTTTIASTPIVRALEIIQEEDATTTVNDINEKPRKVGSTIGVDSTNLKRDIKLVGTPLRKYSESMKNLSQQSSQTKIAIQGSLPNLNEMECIRSIEQNRYFYQSGSLRPDSAMSVIYEQQAQPTLRISKFNSLDDSTDLSNSSQTSLISHAEFNFNQSEILAQSSRFNLNEAGVKLHKGSPVAAKTKPVFRVASGMSPKAAKIGINSPEIVSSHKRRLRDLSFSDSPSTESIASSSCSNNTKSFYGKPVGFMQVSPPKRQRYDSELSFRNPMPTNASAAARTKSWSVTQPSKSKIYKTLALVKKTSTSRNAPSEQRGIKLYDSDLYLQSYINPDPFAATTTCDPFLASTMYLDERAVDTHQNDFKKWLNALVSIPADLNADCDSKIDVGKLFNEVRQKDLLLAPTKEEQSMNYLTKFRLESLRRAAVQLFLSEEMRIPCSKVAVYVNKNAIRIRSDRNLHLDVVMQRYILELLLCFNPLWLRLGLEVVYGEKIHLHSNSDIVGLSTFILNRLFRDKFLEQKYAKAYTLSEEYADHIKKFTLQKMLFLLLFLDKAKSQRIIKHNPCLFVKKSPHKETKQILLKFSSELLANIGDITRELKRLGYVLQHKQVYIDEFDYAFSNLAVDLRDGIRLTRVMEVILLRDDLTQQLRVPAVSRLQRIFNVNLGLRALSEADFQLSGNIIASDIVDGHREKTLSLLWQIIYKFRSPKFHSAARVLQAWWRMAWLRVTIRRKIKRKEEQRRDRAANRIQAVFRGFVTRKYVNDFKTKRCQAVILLQKHVRRHLAQRKLKMCISSIIKIQRWYRAQLQGTNIRQKFVKLRNATVFLQRYYRLRLEARKHTLLKQEAATAIQRYWRSHCLARQKRVNYLQLRAYTIKLQQKFRANKAMTLVRFEYLQLRSTTIFVQQRFRGNKNMLKARTAYKKIYICVVSLQRRYRATIEMRRQIQRFQHIVQAVIALQRRFRAYKKMRLLRAQYQVTYVAITCIQQHFRAFLLKKVAHSNFLKLKNATVTLQRAYRAHKAMVDTRLNYQQLKNATISTQRRYREKLQMRKQLCTYARQRRLIIATQRRFRAILLARKIQYDSTLLIQRKWRATIAARQAQTHFRATIQRVILIQQFWRGTISMRAERQLFQKQKTAALVLQRRFRARCQMLRMRSQYLLIRSLIICIQRKFRANCAMLHDRSNYVLLRRYTILIQQKYRARVQMQQDRCLFLLLQRTALHIQTYARGFLARKRYQAMMTPEMMEFINRKKAAQIIQRFWRGYCIRKRFHSIRLRTIRRNVALLKETATAFNSISYKVQDSVRVLRGRFGASEALHVLRQLERISRTVPHLLMTNIDFISTFCYGIMAQAIRSEVDKQMIEHCSRIILNLARYNSTTANTFQEGGLVTIAQMLLRWCDKDCEIFNTLCTLIWIFAHCPQKRQIIRDFMTTPEAIYVVRETKKLVARKEKMKQNVRKPIVTLRSSSRNFSSSALPSLEPDYGVIHNKPYTFISSVYAFDTILCKLGIEVF